MTKAKNKKALFILLTLCLFLGCFVSSGVHAGLHVSGSKQDGAAKVAHCDFTLTGLEDDEINLSYENMDVTKNFTVKSNWETARTLKVMIYSDKSLAGKAALTLKKDTGDAVDLISTEKELDEGVLYSVHYNLKPGSYTNKFQCNISILDDSEDFTANLHITCQMMQID